MTAEVGPIAEAVEVLRAGGLVGFPTETVYGLGADAANPAALQRLFAVKGRPTDHPVIVHVARAAQLDELGRDVPDVAHVLATACWPGPLTLVVRRRADRVAAAATGGRDTVGIRVPDHPVAIALLDAFGEGIAAPSANRFGRVSPTTAQHVRDDLGTDVDLVLDGGPSAVGVESTIVDVTGERPVILRVGGIPDARLAELVGGRLAHRTSGEVAAPGTLPSHYAPNARVELVAAESVEARAGHLRAEGLKVGVLDAPSDAGDYARSLYHRLRALDRDGVDVILAVPPDAAEGIAAAVADRLRRAASAR
ncbi:MAG: L-threonylcarbamoyladenylate synthase [Actinomycetota bacterium]|nr:L-threonylcarbamoyladenylate synthase [Actinomycetota bacterium]